MSSLQLKTSAQHTELRYKSERLSTVVCFYPEVVAHFHARRQQGKIKTEIGGQLFAEFVKNEVRVVRATGPNPIDKRGWAWFKPDQSNQNVEIKRLFKQRLHFVGDWHTHPEREPRPSSWDMESMEDCFKKSRHQLKAFVMVIVGRADFPGGLWVSVHHNGGSEHLVVDVEKAVVLSRVT
jgi:integrative and conjugative element protein (TIGR02256 family)